VIRLLVRLPLALGLLVPLAWAGVLLWGGGERPVLARACAGLEAAYPSRADRDRLLVEAVRATSAFPVPLEGLGPERSGLLRAGLVVARLHLGAAFRILPFTLLLGMLGVSTGLVFRERMRIEAGYASPTAAGLGRGGVGAGILWLALFGLSPLPVSLGWLYLSPAALLLGGSLYVANLPLRL
jgi:hypothetical protein